MTRRDVLDTLKKLPPHCFAKLPSTGEIIGIRRGEAGYIKLALSNPPQSLADADERLALLNEGLATPAQVEAMLIGSMMGWEVPGADPDIYEVQTTLRVKPNLLTSR